ncbi:MAG: hypothetical protein ABMA15_23415 [Vicinamibacterales bacterium]
MKREWLVVIVFATAVSLSVHAQTPPGRRTLPRTADGHPDLTGFWTTQTYTPLERPARYAGQEFLTDAEAAELTKLLTQPGVDPLAAGIFGATDEQRRARVNQNDPTHYDNSLWLTPENAKALSSLRTSLIVDPPDGRLPAQTPEAKQRVAAARALIGFDSYENRPMQERCILWTHEGPPMMPPPYNDLMEIVQTRDHVIVTRELAAPRLIPIDGRPHLPESLRRWGGDSRGRWEGDTLVVDTTNFHPKTAMLGSTGTLHVLERFTRVNADRIDYRFTVEDPNTWTRPWTAELPIVKTDGPLYEFSCHEANYGLLDILLGARYGEREAVKNPAPAVQPPR